MGGPTDLFLGHGRETYRRKGIWQACNGVARRLLGDRVSNLGKAGYFLIFITQYLLRIYYVPGAGDMVGSNLTKSPALLDLTFWWGERDNTQRKCIMQPLEGVKFYGEHETRKEEWGCWKHMGRGCTFRYSGQARSRQNGATGQRCEGGVM